MAGYRRQPFMETVMSSKADLRKVRSGGCENQGGFMTEIWGWFSNK